MSFFKNLLRANRAKKIAKTQKEMDIIDEKGYIDKSDKYKIKSTGKIAKLKEKNRIASENNLRAIQNTTQNKEVNVGCYNKLASENKAGINDVDIKKSKPSTPKKSKTKVKKGKSKNK